MNTKSLPLRIAVALVLLLALGALGLRAALGTDWVPADAGRCLPEAVDCVDTIGDPLPGEGIDVGEPAPGSGMCPIDVTDCDDTADDMVWTPIEVTPDVEGDVTVPTGEFVDAIGNDLTVGFWMGTDACFAVKAVDVTETDTKVAVDISVVRLAGIDACIEIAEARSVTVTLDAPLGGRILEIGGAPING